jgi:hypothetical protein
VLQTSENGSRGACAGSSRADRKAVQALSARRERRRRVWRLRGARARDAPRGREPNDGMGLRRPVVQRPPLRAIAAGKTAQRQQILVVLHYEIVASDEAPDSVRHLKG